MYPTLCLLCRRLASSSLPSTAKWLTGVAGSRYGSNPNVPTLVCDWSALSPLLLPHPVSPLSTFLTFLPQVRSAGSSVKNGFKAVVRRASIIASKAKDKLEKSSLDAEWQDQSSSDPNVDDERGK